MRLSADLFLSYVRSRIEKTGRREQFSLSAWPPTHIESDRQTGCEGATAEGKRGKQRGSRKGKGRKENAAVFPSSSHFASKFYFSSRHSPTGLSLSLSRSPSLSRFLFHIRQRDQGRHARTERETQRGAAAAAERQHTVVSRDISLSSSSSFFPRQTQLQEIKSTNQVRSDAHAFAQQNSGSSSRGIRRDHSCLLTPPLPSSLESPSLSLPLSCCCCLARGSACDAGQVFALSPQRRSGAHSRERESDPRNKEAPESVCVLANKGASIALRNLSACNEMSDE